MNEEKQKMIQAINAAYPHMSAERRGYLLGYTEAMADRQDDEKKKEAEDKSA